MKKVKQVILCSIITLYCVTTAFFVPTSDAIIGKWEEESGVRTIEIYKVKDKFFGKIIKNSHQQDDELTAGTVFMKDFEFKPNDGIWKGEVYLPAKDMTLGTKIISENANQIKSVAHWGFISKSKTWHRL